MKRSDSIPALIWCLIGISVMGASYQLSLGSWHSPGPGLMPFLLGCLLIIVSLPIFIGSLVRLKRIPEATGETGIWAGVDFKKILSILAGLVIYALLLEKLGFLLMTSLFLFTLFATFDSRRWFFALWTALVAVSITYILFVMVLKVELPHGIVAIW